MTKPQTTPAAKKLVTKMAEQKLIKFDPSATYRFEHYSFSPLQKSMGAWSWQLLKDGKPTQLGSSWGVRELLVQGNLCISQTGSIEPVKYRQPNHYSETGCIGGLR